MNKTIEDPRLLPYDSLVAEVEQLRRDNEMLSLNIRELTKTNEFLVSATWREREMKSKLHNALEELKVTKKVVDEQHKSITDSINYASRIQDAIIPRHDHVRGTFRDIFIYHQAKDIVSGDFPWFFDNDQSVYIAAVDCTGHGVPGAMMSLIGHLLLNDIARHNDIDPASLLAHLHKGVVRTLKQDEEGKQTADGMDVALCRIDRAGVLQFAGAHRPLYHFRDGELQVYTGDRFPVGGNQYKGRNSFTNHCIEVRTGDCFYFFSDGLTDQFGGPDGMKFGSKRVREFLSEIAMLDMQQQHHRLRSAFEEWKGPHRQIDDVLVVGLKF